MIPRRPTFTPSRPRSPDSPAGHLDRRRQIEGRRHRRLRGPRRPRVRHCSASSGRRAARSPRPAPNTESACTDSGVLEAAVGRAAALARPGDHVLSSPAFASFDQFQGYADRGAQFTTFVRATVWPAASRPATNLFPQLLSRLNTMKILKISGIVAAIHVAFSCSFLPFPGCHPPAKTSAERRHRGSSPSAGAMAGRSGLRQQRPRSGPAPSPRPPRDLIPTRLRTPLFTPTRPGSSAGVGAAPAPCPRRRRQLLRRQLRPPTRHVVVSGESLWSIANKYKIAVKPRTGQGQQHQPSAPCLHPARNYSCQMRVMRWPPQTPAPSRRRCWEKARQSYPLPPLRRPPM